MTREAAIKILMDGELNPCVAEDREACDMAIKALEQEPILDKIRAEIETKYGQCDICEYDAISGWEQVSDIADILQIIDKYKAESEQTDGNDD